MGLIIYKRRVRKHVRVETSRSREWSDLPQGIVELIINKLHLSDQIRALAVCKDWRVCKSYITNSDTLPWVVSYEKHRDDKTRKLSVMCKLFDPYSQKVVLEVCMYGDSPWIYVLDSRHGWLLLGDDTTDLFLHNPFTNEKIDLPLSIQYLNRQAMMSASPTSPQCKVSMLSIENGCFHLESCCLSKLDNMKKVAKKIDNMEDSELIHSMLYMKGNFHYALFQNEVLNIYVLKEGSSKSNRKRKKKDGSSELLASGFPEPYESCDAMKNVWLMEVDGNFIIVRLDEGYKWRMFRFDWSENSWVVETNLMGCAIYVTHSVAFSAPLTDNHGEILEDCRLFYLDEGVYDDEEDEEDGDGTLIKCYSLREAGGTRIRKNEYGWMKEYDIRDWGFVQPPHFRI